NLFTAPHAAKTAGISLKTRAVEKRLKTYVSLNGRYRQLGAGGTLSASTVNSEGMGHGTAATLLAPPSMPLQASRQRPVSIATAARRPMYQSPNHRGCAVRSSVPPPVSLWSAAAFVIRPFGVLVPARPWLNHRRHASAGLTPRLINVADNGP